MKNMHLWILALLGSLFLSACSNTSTNTSTYRKITAQEALQIMGDSEEYILLDVRTEEEFREQHIEGALLIPDHQLASDAEEKLPDKNTSILVYCRSGRRSANAAKILEQMGYAKVYDFGGIIDWPYDTVIGE